LLDGSGVSREAPAPFCERPGVQLPRSTHHEGFNVQKNGGFALEHVYSNDETACKVFYLLLQIACILSQLIERGSLFRKAFPRGVGSAKNIAFRLLEAWRNFRLTGELLDRIRTQHVQIRFDTS
jgi:hypothetical protein